MVRLRAPRRSFLYHGPVNQTLFFVFIVAFVLAGTAVKSQELNSKSHQINQLHTLFHKDRIVVSKVEEYSAENFIRNNFFAEYVRGKALHLSQRDQDKVAFSLLESFRSSQKELFRAGYANPSQIDDLISAHKSSFLAELDQLYTDALMSLNGMQRRGKKPTEQLLSQPQYCENMDFEACDFSNWQIANGRVNNVPYGFTNRVVTAVFGQGLPVDDGLQHSILSVAQQDPVVPIQTVRPGGTCSAVLGDRLGDGYLAASMTRQFDVTAENYFFTYSYAVIMEDPTNVHTPGERPYFTVRLWDQNNNPISCGDYEVYSGDGNAAWISSPTTPTGTPIVYTDWTDALIPLQNYIGQTITIEFATGDCNLGGHAAYAYVEANCGGEILVTDTFTCPGVPVTLTAPDGASSYTWSNGETTQQIVTQDSGTYTVVMGGTADNSCTTQLSKRIHLKTPPIGDFSADTVCLNEATSFIDKSSPATTGIAAWRWDTDNDGTFDGNGQAYSFTFATPGQHSVMLEVQDANGCLDDTTFTVLVNDLPVADFTAASVCLNDSTLMTNQASNYAVLTWDVFNDGSVLRNDSDLTYLFSQAGSQSVKLTAETAEGCTDEITKDVVINPNPSASFSYQEVCFPGLVNYTDASSVPSGQITAWSWDFGDIALTDDTANTQNSSYAHANYQEYDVRLIVVSDSGCVDTTQNTISYFEKPVVDFDAERVCQNQMMQFNNSSSVGSSSFATWNWDIGNNGVINYLSEDATHTFSDAGTDSVRLIGITVEGCRDTSTQEVIVDTLPVADFNALPVCFNEESTLLDGSEGNIATYAWDLYVDGVIDGANDQINHTFFTDGAHDVKLLVVTDRGCKDSVEKQILVNPLPVANFRLDSVCSFYENTFIDLSEVSSGNVTSFEWTFGDGSPLSDAQNTNHLYGQFGSYPVQLKVTSDSSCVDSITKTAVVFEKPVVDFSLNDICENESTNLINTSPAFSGSFGSWSWDVSVNNSEEYTTLDASHQFTNDGVDSIQLIGVSTDGCRDTIVKSLTIHPLPTAFFEIPSECFGEEATFEDKSVGSIVAWSWDIGSDGTVEYSQQNPAHTFVSDGRETIELMVETDQGCRDSIDLTTDTYPLPVAAFSFDDVCHTFESAFVSSSTVTTGSLADVMWEMGDGTGYQNQNQVSHTYAQSGQYQIDLTVVSDRGCRDSVAQTHTVFAPPVADFVFIEACLNQAVSLSSTSTPSGLNYSWDVDANGVEDYSTSSVSHNYPNSGLKAVVLKVVDAEGCADTIQKDVQVFSLPTASFTLSNVCLGVPNEFVDGSYDADNDLVSWQWDFEEDGVVNSTSEDAQYTLSRVGNYSSSLIVENDKGCKDTIAKDASVYPIPVVDFDPTEVCYQDETSFSNLSSIANVDGQSNNLASFNWAFGANGNSFEENPQRVFDQEGQFDVRLTVTSNFGCIDSIVKTVNVNPVPIVDMSSSLPEGCTTWCVDFQDESTISGGNIVSHNWSFENGANLNGTNVSTCFENGLDVPVYYDAQLTVVSDKGCSNSAFYDDYVTVYPHAVAEFEYSPDVVTDQQPIFNFENYSQGSIWRWDFGEGSVSEEHSPSHRFPEAGIYDVKLVADNEWSCPDSIVKPVEVLPTTAFYAPNAITVNGDGRNDIFYIYGYNITEFKMHIFDRWGLRLFTSNSMDEGWDGTYRGDDVQQDVYIYKAFITDIFNEQHTLIGTVTVVK